MEVPLDDNDPNFGKVLSAKKDAAATTITALLKSDENQFKRRDSKVLDDILSEIRRADRAKEIILVQ